jgi:hypothetical protein
MKMRSTDVQILRPSTSNVRQDLVGHSHLEYFRPSLLVIPVIELLIRTVMNLKEFNAVGVCRHLRRIRFLFRDERFEFLRCEGCGEIVRLPLQPVVAL